MCARDFNALLSHVRFEADGVTEVLDHCWTDAPRPEGESEARTSEAETSGRVSDVSAASGLYAGITSM